MTIKPLWLAETRLQNKRDLTKPLWLAEIRLQNKRDLTPPSRQTPLSS